MPAKEPTWRLTRRGWNVLTCFCCLLAGVATWTVVPVVAPWATAHL